jgi:hypothetical protein
MGGMHPSYFDTRFRSEIVPLPPPEAFAILSAQATTGSTWSPERNASADAALKRVLVERGGWLHRLVGYSPKTQHAEPSWAAVMPLEEACRLGQEFFQDAIYWVEHDRLFVLECHAPGRCVFVDIFSRRLDPS